MPVTEKVSTLHYHSFNEGYYYGMINRVFEDAGSSVGRFVSNGEYFEIKNNKITYHYYRINGVILYDFLKTPFPSREKQLLIVLKHGGNFLPENIKRIEPK